METSLSSCDHICTHLGILIAGEVVEKEELENLLMLGEFFFHVMVDREISTYMKNKKYLIWIVNKKFKIVNGAVWSNPLIFLIHYLFGITYLESIFRLRRNQVVDLHIQELTTVPE